MKGNDGILLSGLIFTAFLFGRSKPNAVNNTPVRMPSALPPSGVGTIVPPANNVVASFTPTEAFVPEIIQPEQIIDIQPDGTIATQPYIPPLRMIVNPSTEQGRIINPDGSQTVIAPNGQITANAAPTPAIYSDGSVGDLKVNGDGSITYTHDPIVYNYGDPAYKIALPTPATDDNGNVTGSTLIHLDGTVTYNYDPSAPQYQWDQSQFKWVLV